MRLSVFDAANNLLGTDSHRIQLDNTEPEAPAPGDHWTLNTSGMRSCGYVIQVFASDRAIVDSQTVGHHASDSAGFCLEEPLKE